MISTKQFVGSAGRAIVLIVSGFTMISFAIILYQLKIGAGFWLPDMANHVYIEIITFIAMAGTLLFWGFEILYHLSKFAKWRKKKLEKDY